jgi:hypothetical protein
MTLPYDLLRSLSTASPDEAWAALGAFALDIFRPDIDPAKSVSEFSRRDREVASADFYLSTAGWDLWRDLDTATTHTADRLADWWTQPHAKKAVLILDGLSLRELPFILSGASAHGFTVHAVAVTTSELPSETTQFAQALGFAQRSSLSNNAAGNGHRLPGARTECADLPWLDCANMIGAEPNWVFWHHWPDSRVHDLSVAGQGLETLSKEAAETLLSAEFWGFVDRLATGRRVIITSDHGYAAPGLFADAPEEQAKFLRDTFKSGRSAPGPGDTGPWVPPIAMSMASRRGDCRLALGRRKWKSQGGYPTLAHGGLSLLEVLSPYVELTKQGQS